MTEWVLIQKDELDRTLAQSPVQGKRSLEPMRRQAVRCGVPLHVVEDHEVLNNPAEVHLHEADFWICLQGEAVFTLGGELVNPVVNPTNSNELSAAEIRGGEQVTLHPGDMLWIPPGTPHVHNCAGTTRLLIIKVKQ